MKTKNQAIFFIILSAFCFNFMDILVRLSGDLPSIQKSFFRNLVAAAVAATVLIRSGEGFHPRKRNLPLLVLRASFGTVGIVCNYYAVDHLLLANASMLHKMSPFFVLIFSLIILKEKLSLFQILAVTVAFAGSMFVVKPVLGNMDLMPSLIGILGGCAAGLAYTMVRKLSLRGEKATTIVLFFSSFSCLAVLPWLIFNGVAMSWQQLLCLLGAGVAAAGGQFAVTAAYARAPGREVSVYDYSQVVFSAVFGFLFFGDIPDGLSFVGYVLIIGAAVAIFLYSNRKQPAPDRKPGA